MKNPSVKINIRDNLNSDFKDEDNYIEVKLLKNNIDGKVLLEMLKHGLSKILPFMESKSSFFKKTTKITPNLGVKPVNYFKFPLYESLLKNKKTIDKELKKIMPSILQDISKTLDSYEWNVDIEYRRGFRGDNLLYFLNTMNGESNDDYYNVYNIINIQSVKYPDIKGEIIFDEFLCLYDKSNHVDLNNGKRYGTLNLFYSFSQYKLNFIDIKNKTYKYKLLLDHDSCSIKEVKDLNRNFNEFIKNYGDCYKPLKDFNILIEVLDKLTWRMCYSMTSGNIFIIKNEYFSEEKFSIEKNSESDILRAIIELMKYMSQIQSVDNEKFVLNYDYIDGIIENQDLTKNEFKELFETLELLKY